MVGPAGPTTVTDGRLVVEGTLPGPVTVVTSGSQSSTLSGQGIVGDLTVTGGELTLRVSGCFIFIGFRPNTGLVKQHFAHDASGYMLTDDRMMTSIPGLFAAGDLRVQLTRQITTAVGDATTAAIAVEKFLKERQSGVLGVKVGV